MPSNQLSTRDKEHPLPDFHRIFPPNTPIGRKVRSGCPLPTLDTVTGTEEYVTRIIMQAREQFPDRIQQGYFFALCRDLLDGAMIQTEAPVEKGTSTLPHVFESFYADGPPEAEEEFTTNPLSGRLINPRWALTPAVNTEELGVIRNSFYTAVLTFFQKKKDPRAISKAIRFSNLFFYELGGEMIFNRLVVVVRDYRSRDLNAARLVDAIPEVKGDDTPYTVHEFKTLYTAMEKAKQVVRTVTKLSPIDMLDLNIVSLATFRAYETVSDYAGQENPEIVAWVERFASKREVAISKRELAVQLLAQDVGASRSKLTAEYKFNATLALLCRTFGMGVLLAVAKDTVDKLNELALEDAVAVIDIFSRHAPFFQEVCHMLLVKFLTPIQSADPLPINFLRAEDGSTSLTTRIEDALAGF